MTLILRRALAVLMACTSIGVSPALAQHESAADNDRLIPLTVVSVERGGEPLSLITAEVLPAKRGDSTSSVQFFGRNLNPGQTVLAPLVVSRAQLKLNQDVATSTLEIDPRQAALAYRTTREWRAASIDLGARLDQRLETLTHPIEFWRHAAREGLRREARVLQPLMTESRVQSLTEALLEPEIAPAEKVMLLRLVDSLGGQLGHRWLAMKLLSQVPIELRQRSISILGRSPYPSSREALRRCAAADLGAASQRCLRWLGKGVR